MIGIIGREVDPEVGSLESAWRTTKQAHDDFMAVLSAWDSSGRNDEDKDGVREAAKKFIAVWRALK